MHQAHLLQGKLCQPGVTKMLMVWDTEESHASGNTILSCPEVLFQELGKKSDGEPEGVAGSWLWIKLSKQTLPGGISWPSGSEVPQKPFSSATAQHYHRIYSLCAGKPLIEHLPNLIISWFLGKDLKKDHTYKFTCIFSPAAFTSHKMWYVFFFFSVSNHWISCAFPLALFKNRLCHA